MPSAPIDGGRGALDGVIARRGSSNGVFTTNIALESYVCFETPFPVPPTLCAPRMADEWVLELGRLPDSEMVASFRSRCTKTAREEDITAMQDSPV